MANALAELIRARCAERGWSLAEVARRGGMPVQTVHALQRERELRQTPRPLTLERLAAGLEVELETVQQAASESVGYVLAYEQLGPELRALVARAATLTPQARAQLAAVVERELARQARLERKRDGAGNGGGSYMTLGMR